MTNTVLYDSKDAVATITLNRPDSLNSFDADLRADLISATSEAKDDSAIRAVVLTGAGRCFSAGADLKAGFKTGSEVEHMLVNEYKPSLMNIAEMEKPVISAINGFAAGIGLSFAMISDLSIMAESAFLLSPFSSIGLVPDGGATWLLTNGMGYKQAYELAIENERLPAQRCKELGIINRIAADDVLLSTAQEWATALAQKAPLAMARTKKLMREAHKLDYAAAINSEAALQNLCIDSRDSREGITAFLEKRPAVFTGE
ncbi:MAG: enoyl-CoA hydratase/isomerase family protein [Gammaproteobacteria bacterium]|nr:enoyl-CoA hydratase/isomerase family protein [Gammaproteobacteria bacterium]